MYKLYLTYQLDQQVFTVSESNEDVEIETLTTDKKLGERIQVKLDAKKEIEILDVSYEKDIFLDAASQMMLNGYQSWTQTKIFTINDHMIGLGKFARLLNKKYKLDKYGDYLFTTYDKDLLHGFTYMTINQENDDAYHLIGSLNDFVSYLVIYIHKKDQKLILSSDLKHFKVKGEIMLYDFLDLNGSYQDVYDMYFNYVPWIEPRPKLVGYTSWYQHYQNISYDKLILETHDLKQRGFDLFQIDDGYQTFIGDWMEIDPLKFPNGLDQLIHEVKSQDVIAGLWMAPFVCETKSRIFKEKPHFIRKDSTGQFVEAGSNWSGFYMLDWEKDEVKSYIKSCFDFYHKKGIKLYKLDFLYAANLDLFEGETRASQMRKALEFLRSCCKDQYILGCGVPVSSSFGLLDYLRIGPDISLKFNDTWYMKWIHRERISTKETILNTIFRYPLNQKVFHNDPDVFILRTENNQLSENQKIALTYINHLMGHLILTSDTYDLYTDAQKQIYLEAQKLTHATHIKVKQVKNIIHISYQLNKLFITLSYDYKKGVFAKVDIKEKKEV